MRIFAINLSMVNLFVIVMYKYHAKLSIEIFLI
ncbi:hypothetical protein SAMN03080594_10547 [Arenibacter palladensis]|uniref:Uncharacterized protein n=1 Tax=Arenibacter palladensis TaxID=237373 RepID=A0A1M5CHI4_9FLAO|nr:hypothetical protein SAMN03080594_10547 [Arenibacter palladensis]